MRVCQPSVAGVRQLHILDKRIAQSRHLPENGRLRLRANNVPDADPRLHLRSLLRDLPLPLRVLQVASPQQQKVQAL